MVQENLRIEDKVKVVLLIMGDTCIDRNGAGIDGISG